MICFVLGSFISASADELTAGVGKQTFSLPAGVPLAGYSKRQGKPSTGANDALGARALVMGDGTKAVALISCDLLIIDELVFSAVKKRLSSTLGSAAPYLLIAATHTHSGPGAYGKKFFEKLSMGHYDPHVFEAIVSAICQAVIAAEADRRPVRLACALKEVPAVIKNRVREGDFVDAQLPVCGLYATGSAVPRALLTGFAAHPTTLGAWNQALSGDYPGVVVETLEKEMPQATVFFFAGAVGDQAPIKADDRLKRPQAVALPLVDAIRGILPELKPQTPATLRIRQEVMRLPRARVRLGKRFTLPRWLGRRLVDDDATLSVVVAGSTVWFGVPCDLSASLGRQLKEAARAKGLFPFVVGFANDYIGYCMPETLYDSGEYEALMAFNGPKAGEIIVERLEAMLNEVAGDGS